MGDPGRRRSALVGLAAAIAAGLLLAALGGWLNGETSAVGDVRTTTIAVIDAAAVASPAPTSASPDDTTTSSRASETTTTSPVPAATLAPPFGALPDGTEYRIHAEPPLGETVQSEDTAANEVHYESFFVTAGCGADAAACSDTNAVQLVPMQAVEDQAAPWDEGRLIWLESVAPRPTDDASWLDPGPLVPRGDHDVHWTGTEMIVWGGADGDRQPNLIDGARFDPATSTWAMLAPAPFEQPVTTRSVWAGDRLVVVSEEATYGYFPNEDIWAQLGDGATPSRWAGFMAWTGSEVVMWNVLGVQRFEVATGRWESLGPPPFGSDESPWHGALRIQEGEIYAVGVASACSGKYIARHDGTSWVELPRVSVATEMYADCSFPNQTAAVDGTFMVWEESSHPTKMLIDGLWAEVAGIPLHGTEGPQGPVAMGDRTLVPQWGSAAIFDPATGRWTEVLDLPGSGSTTDMVWTGSELLMWGATCCYGGGSGPFRIDAWRWTPPE